MPGSVIRSTRAVAVIIQAVSAPLMVLWATRVGRVGAGATTGAEAAAAGAGAAPVVTISVTAGGVGAVAARDGVAWSTGAGAAGGDCANEGTRAEAARMARASKVLRMEVNSLL